MATKLVFDRTHNNQETYSGISEVAPLQNYPGGYGTPEKVVLLRVDPDFGLDELPPTVEKGKSFSGITEFAPFYVGRGYDFNIQINAVIDEHFGIKGENVKSVREYKVNKYIPKTSSNKIGTHDTVIDPAFKL